MMMKFSLLMAAAFLSNSFAAISPTPRPGKKLEDSKPMKRLEDLQLEAVQYHTVLTLPKWEKTPQQISAAVNKIIGLSNKRLDAVAALKPADATFANTFQEMDMIAFENASVANRIVWIKETHPEAKMRDAAQDAIKKFEDWSVSTDYREDVYRVLQAFADTKPKGDEEDARLVHDTLLGYKRAGLALPTDQRNRVEALRKELASVGNDFDKNIADAASPVKFTKAELEGVPASVLETPGVKTGDDEYTIDTNVTFQALGVLENGVIEASRKKVYISRDNRARDKNIALIQKMVELRSEIALQLGYKSWDDYQIEERMAKDGATALKFLQDLKVGLQPKYDEELAEFKAIKAADSRSETVDVNIWDWRFCAEQLKKQKYQVDTESLRNFFPYQKVLEGMFATYKRIFGIKIEPVALEDSWTDGVQLYYVSDAKSSVPLGLFYLDMFPREGKYNHFAQFGLIEGKLLPNGTYQRPAAALCCNFPPPRKDAPSLLSHDEVETLFHEFGHAMHTILTQTKYVRFSGTSVPQDFVEAPSQMLENWVWDKAVLDSFAADYRNPKKKMPADILKKMRAAKFALSGTTYRRQLSFGITDLVLHGPHAPGEKLDVLKISNDILSDSFLPVAPETAMVASFGHLNGYDGGYYGYAWADAIAADMATVFEKSPGGFLDKDAGMKMRNEIYAQGDARDVEVSIEKFLGRARSIQPFLEYIGINAAEKMPADSTATPLKKTSH